MTRPSATVRVLLALLALALGSTLASPAGGQRQRATGTMALVTQTPWRVGDVPFDLVLRVATEGRVEGIEVAASLFRRVPHRSEFVQTLAGRLRGSVLAVERRSLAELPQGPDGSITFSLRPDLTREGVYPLRVELRERGGGAVLDSFVTHLVNVPAPIEGDKLEAALVFPVHARPALRPDGGTGLEGRRADELASLAAGLAGALGAHPGVALTLAPTPETVDALASGGRVQDRETVAALARVAAARRVLAGPYAATNLTSLLQAGLEAEAHRQLATGGDVLRQHLTPALDGAARLLDERLDEESFQFLRDRSVTRLVIPEPLLEPIDLDTTLTGTFLVAGRRGSIRAAVADAGLASHFIGDESPALAAHHLLADLAVVYYDSPGRLGSRRGVVVVPPRSWRPNRILVEELVRGLAISPIVAPTSLDRLFDDLRVVTSRGRPLVRRFVASSAAAPSLGVDPSTIEGTRRQIESFSSIAGPDNPVVERMNRTLLTGQSSDLRGGQREAYVEGVRDQIRAELVQVSMPDRRSITLTGRQGEFPITITNQLPYPISVVVHIDSETLAFPDGATRVLNLTRRNTSETFRVRVRSSGSFPVRIRLRAPEGDLVVTQSRLTVRSTATSGVGIALSIGAAAFLLVWWGLHLRGRRSRKLVPAS